MSKSTPHHDSRHSGDQDRPDRLRRADPRDETEIHMPAQPVVDPEQTEIRTPRRQIDDSSGATPSSVPIDRQDTVITSGDPQPQVGTLRPSTPREIGQFLEGMSLGHYRLDQFVGSGGMGAVFRSTDTMLGRTVAVKVLSRRQSDEDLLKRFRNEAQSAARLDHENIARVYYVGEEDGWNYIVFEYIEGDDIRDLVTQRGPLTVDNALSYTLQVAEALDHAHKRDVIHRDIKPSNVVITHEGRVKLVDMGLARLHHVEASETDLTVSGVTLGTFDYISPEQAHDPRSADVRSDLYSLGCTLYFMLCGQPPFPDGTVLQKLLNHSSPQRPNVRLIRPDIPKPVTVILDRMLAAQPAKRHQEPMELIREILMVAEDLGIPVRTSVNLVIDSAPPQARWYETALPFVLPAIALLITVLMIDWALPDSRAQRSLQPPQLVDPSNSAADSSDHNDSQRPGGADTSPESSRVPEDNSASSSGAQSQDPDGNSTDDQGSPQQPDPQPTQPNGTSEAGNARSAEGQPGTVPDRGAAARIPDALVRTLVVGTLEEGDIATVAYASLDTALAAIPRYENLNEIRIRNHSARITQPFALQGKNLVIRGDAAARPLLRFEPANDQQTKMIQLRAETLQWLNVDFHFKLPSQRSSKQWSLFELIDVDQLTLTNCSLTIDNASDELGQLQSTTSFFDVPAPAETHIEQDDRVTVRPAPWIQMVNCIARGQANLIHVPEATPFNLKWNEGVLITNQRMIVMGGAAKQHRFFSRVEAYLDKVTVVARQGLVLAATTDDRPFQPQLYVKSNSCLFVTRAQTPLVQHVEPEAGDTQDAQSLKQRFFFEGDNNFFPDSNPVWAIVSTSTQTVQAFGLEDVARQPAWFDQTIVSTLSQAWPDGHPEWRQPAHQQTVSDYLLPDSPTNPAVLRGAGYQLDPKLQFPKSDAGAAGQLRAL